MSTLADLLISVDNRPNTDAVHQQASLKSQALGLPTRKWRAWKYDTLSDVFKRSAKLTTDSVVVSSSSDNANRIVLINGIYQAKLSQLPQGIEIVQQSEDPLWYDFIKQLPTQEALAWLGLRIQPARIHISVAANSQVDNLTIIHHNNSDEDTTAVANISWTLAHNAVLNTLTEFHGKSNLGCYVLNQTVALAKHAHWRCDVVQKLPTSASVFSHLYAKLADHANYQQTTLHFASQRTRSYEQVDLLGTRASTSFKGLALPQAQQKHQQLLCINHRATHTQSEQHFKSAVASNAMFNFVGRIFVQEHAQKTDASQLNHNMLMSKNAAAYTKPELEIYADDVKCAHGTTIGQVDKNKLLFLQMRGLDPAKAKWLILSGFCSEMLDFFHSEAAKQTATKAIAQLVDA